MEKILNILNLTQHQGTPEQGVYEPENKQLVKELLTFDAPPTKADIDSRAAALADIAVYHADCNDCWHAMIGGAPFFMGALERALKARGIQPVYSFTRRESKDLPGGKKISVFKHVEFIEA